VLVLAHAAGGNTVGVPTWLLAAMLIVGTTLTWTALRTSWPKPRLADAAEGRVLNGTAGLRRGLVVAAATVGLVVWAVTLTAGLFAVDEPTENLGPFVLCIQLLCGGMLLAALVGDWWKAASPFATLARLLPDRHADEANAAPAWTAPVLLASFLWLVDCYHAGGDPRSGGIWLLLYSLAALTGCVVWGRWWLDGGEGFAVLFGSVARLAPFGRDTQSGRIVLRAPLSGLGPTDLPAGAGPTLVLAASAAAFSAVRRTTWWQVDIVHLKVGWDRTLIDTVGFAFVAGVAALVWMAVTRRLPTPAAVAAAVKPLVPLSLGIVTAFLFTELVTRSVDVLALLSDPYGKDWNLLGTADWFPDARWQVSVRLAWTELLALLVGAVAAVIVAHDGALVTAKGRARAERALLPQLAAGTLLATAALLVLLR
jgi:hypothetical protein